MKDNTSDLHTTNCNANSGEETLWQTLAGCALFWAGLLTLCWIL